MNRKQLIIAGIVIVVLGLIYLLSSSGRTVQKSVDAAVLTVDSSSVFSLAVTSNMATVRFDRGSEGWKLDDYDVNATSFDRLFTTLTHMKLDRFVSQNPSKYAQYGVDSNATRVTLANESGAIEKEYFIGNASTGGNETFVREKGGQKVYTVMQNLAQYKRLEKSAYWKRDIISWQPEDIFSIQAEGNFNFLLEQKNMGWTFNGQLIDLKKGDDLVRKLVSQKASKVSKEAVPSVALLLATITVTPRNGQAAVLKYYENDETSTVVFVELAGNPMRFEMYKSTFEGFDKKFEDLKPEEQPVAEQPVSE